MTYFPCPILDSEGMRHLTGAIEARTRALNAVCANRRYRASSGITCCVGGEAGLQATWPRKKYVSSARLRRALDNRSGVRTQYEIAFNAIIVINTTAKPQPNNIVLL
jgi:hypothetical protein